MRSSVWTLALIAIAWQLACPISGGAVAAPTLPTPYEKNGVRLMGLGGSKIRGRLELSLPGGLWVPVCANAFTEELAQVMCELLGYKYGMPYYRPELSYRANESYSGPYPAGEISCSSDTRGDDRRRSRHLREAADTASTAGWRSDTRLMSGKDDAEFGVDGDKLASRGRQWRRRALAAARPGGFVDIPTAMNLSCFIYRGECNATRGPFAGVSCANKPLPPAPPPPPSPPPPSPAPPPAQQLIRVIGLADSPGSEPDQLLQPNLCLPPNPNGICDGYSRVELLVDPPPAANSSSSSGGPTPAKLWAPLCATTQTLARSLADLVCRQRFARPPSPHGGLQQPTVSASVPPKPFVIPKGPITEPADFDPGRIAAWVTVIGGDLDAATSVQGLKYKVATTSCTGGRMFAVRCNVPPAY